MAGVSRSATIVIAYIMWKEHKSYYQAFLDVKYKRKFIAPNKGFIFQLRYFESMLNENNYDLEKIDFVGFNYKEKWDKFINFVGSYK